MEKKTYTKSKERVGGVRDALKGSSESLIGTLRQRIDDMAGVPPVGRQRRPQVAQNAAFCRLLGRSSLCDVDDFILEDAIADAVALVALKKVSRLTFGQIRANSRGHHREQRHHRRHYHRSLEFRTSQERRERRHNRGQSPSTGVRQSRGTRCGEQSQNH